VSILRIKVWHSLQTFDPARWSMPVQRYKFSCVKNQPKDLVKTRWRNGVFFDDFGFDEQTTVGADDVYVDVERELPELPSTLTALGREIIVLFDMGLTRRQVAVTPCMSRTEMQRSMRSIREKLSALPERASEA
jgi:hypothetical protein